MIVRFRTLSCGASGTETVGHREAAPSDVTDNSEKLTATHRPSLSVCLQMQRHERTERNAAVSTVRGYASSCNVLESICRFSVSPKHLCCGIVSIV